ncbi:MAG TPA: MarC family protein [Candidatus Binataceae bacterium]|nr:MarC family protein [Candidatus Binataceae bacterium]
MHDWKTNAEIATALFVIADPIAAVPMFIDLTSGQSRAERNRTAHATAITVAAVLVLSIFLGQPLLELFGIRIASFRVGGGILILLMAISMLNARVSRTVSTPEEVQEGVEKDDPAVVPLGIPLVAGPGAISTMIIYARQATDAYDTIFLVLTGLMVALTVLISLRMAEPIRRLLGKTGINIINRLAGLVLAAIAVEFIAGGLVELMPGLAH